VNDLGPLIGPDGVVVAGATWFAGKILGPSAEAIGENIKIYAQSRLPSIFGRAGKIAEERSIQVEPIKPGLLARMVIDASFSEDTPEITEWWANLFVSASQHNDNRHAVFSDMMATIGPGEAKALDEFYNFVLGQAAGIDLPLVIERSAVVPVIQQNVLKRFNKLLPLSDDDRQRVDVIIATTKVVAAARPYAWCLPARTDDQSDRFPITSEVWFSQKRLEYEVLERSRIVAFERIDVPIMGSQTAYIDYLRLTSLGFEFCKACTGREPQMVYE
jgi:hypothetical protein